MIDSFLRFTLALIAVTVFPTAILAEEADSSPWAEDLGQFRAEFLEVDTSYSPQERAQAEALLTKLEQNFAGLTDAQIELALAEIAALTDNGHSFLMPGGWTVRYPRLPVGFQVFADGIYVIEATAAHRDLAGLKLKSIDGHPVEVLREAWSRYQGGQPGWRNQYLPYFLEAPEMLHAAGLAESANSACLELVDENGTVREQCLAANRERPPLEGFARYISPSRLLLAAGDADPSTLPLYLKQPDRFFRIEILDDLAAVYIQFRANIDFTGKEDINAFLESAEGVLSSQPWPWIIVDQRFNFGGDLTTTRALMKNLAGFLAPKGKIFVITSGRTFSAGIASTGYARQAAGDRLIIVGEPVGDALEFWAEGDIVQLPNSGVAFLKGTERHNYLTGCPEDDCHRNVRIDPIRVDTLEPDISAPLTWSDYAHGTDPAMNAIRSAIAAQPLD